MALIPYKQWLIAKRRRAQGSWDRDMNPDRRAHHIVPPTCHDDVTWQHISDYIIDTSVNQPGDEPTGEK